MGTRYTRIAPMTPITVVMIVLPLTYRWVRIAVSTVRPATMNLFTLPSIVFSFYRRYPNGKWTDSHAKNSHSDKAIAQCNGDHSAKLSG